MVCNWGNSSIKQASGRMLAFTTEVVGFLAPNPREIKEKFGNWDSYSEFIYGTRRYAND